MNALPGTHSPTGPNAPAFTLGSALRRVGYDCPDRGCSQPTDALPAAIWSGEPLAGIHRRRRTTDDVRAVVMTAQRVEFPPPALPARRWPPTIPAGLITMNEAIDKAREALIATIGAIDGPANGAGCRRPSTRGWRADWRRRRRSSNSRRRTFGPTAGPDSWNETTTRQLSPPAPSLRPRYLVSNVQHVRDSVDKGNGALPVPEVACGRPRNEPATACWSAPTLRHRE